MNQEAIGKLFRVVGAAATIGLAACVHAAAKEMPIGQIMAMRAAISGVMIAAYGTAIGKRSELMPKDWHPHLVRGALACIAMYLTFVAFARLPVTQAQTLTYLAPLIILPLAAWRLGETFTVRKMLALGMGFCGVLMILGLSFEAGPSAAWGAICGVGAATLIAIIQVKVRAMTATETSLSIALSFTFVVACVAGLSILWGTWVFPSGAFLWLMVAAGFFGAMNIACFAESLARAPATVVAPLDYTGLIWALLVDWLIFAQMPGPLGILGSVLITLAALIVILKPSKP